MKVFVLLPAQLDAEQWRRDYAKGLTADETPYGYHHAERYGCEVDFSRPTGVGRSVLSLPRKVLSRLLDGDIVHALRNLRQIATGGYDVVWTHTEREHIGLTLVRRALWWIDFPITIAQSVWIMDRWDGLSSLRRAYLTWALRGADILTFLSPVNADDARRHRLNEMVSVVEFGISADSFPARQPAEPAGHAPIRVFAPGNDMHRDWATFAEALGDDDRFEVVVASRYFPKHLQRRNFKVVSLTQAEVREMYDWADVVAVPLKENRHASGVSVLLESILLGKRVVATGTGGLDHYFPGQPELFCPPGDAAALREQIARAAEAESAAVAAAQSHLLARDYTTRGYARRHVVLSEALLRRLPVPELLPESSVN